MKVRAFPTIVYGGLAVAVLDGLAATIHAAVLGVLPTRVWQYVASSVVGLTSFEGGSTMVALGLLFHFCVAFAVATVYYLLARITPHLVRYPIPAGTLYGIAVYFAMTYVIVPLTLVRQSAFSWYGLISGIIIHILFVGLPVALVARRYSD